MKKKRFIKLLMAEGISRNDARIHAEWVAWDNIMTCKFNHIIKTNGFQNRCPLRTYKVEYDNIKVALEEYACKFREEV